MRAQILDLESFLCSVSLTAMDVGEGSSQPHHASISSREETIQMGHTVLLKIPSGDIRTIKLENNACA